MKCQVHGVLAHAGIWVPMSDLFGVAGRQLLAELSTGERLSIESRSRLDSALRVIGALEFEIELFTKLVNGRLRTDPGYRAIQQIPGVGRVLAAVFVAEIGDITRFHRPEQLASWAGLTPKHHESDTTVHRGRITKMGCGGRGRGLRLDRPECGEVVVAIVGGIDIHRAQLTFDYVDLDSGEVFRGRIARLTGHSCGNGWTGSSSGPMWRSRWRAAPAGATSSRAPPCRHHRARRRTGRDRGTTWPETPRQDRPLRRPAAA